MSGIFGFAGLLVLALLLVLYLLPWGIAIERKHPHTIAIALVNIFLGWSFVGWMVALVWSLTTPNTNARGGNNSIVVNNVVNGNDQTSSSTKQCPECGETIMAVAKKCKHCNSQLQTSQSEFVPPDTSMGSGLPMDSYRFKSSRRK